MHRVIILAGGGTRKGWTLEHPKVMAEVEGKPIVLRVVQQVRDREHECIVLADNKHVVQAVMKTVACYVSPPHPPEMDWHYERPVGGLANSVFLWSKRERTVLLCGDTAYPDEAMDAILADKSLVSVWGNWEEIVAITFAPEEYQRMEEAVYDALHNKESGIGHLWVLYRVLCGFNVNAHKFDDVIFKDLGRETYMIDFDSVEKHEKWLENNPWAQG